MPLEFNIKDDESIQFDEFIESLRSTRFNPSDVESLAQVAPLLKKLGNNRDFLSDIVISELKEHCKTQREWNGYSAQVIILHNDDDNFFIRANFWPSPQDSIYKSSGADPFLYHHPHNHNFNFLTIGYSGSGYWSDYYKLDYTNVIGFPGEKVTLDFIKRARLNEGQILLYEAHTDVHDQLPPDDFSITINIMESTSQIDYLDQYGFDIQTSTINNDIISHIPIESLFAYASFLDEKGGNMWEVIEKIGFTHPSHRIRGSALTSLIKSEADPRKKELLIGKYLSNTDSLYVRNILLNYQSTVTHFEEWTRDFEKTIMPSLTND